MFGALLLLRVIDGQISITGSMVCVYTYIGFMAGRVGRDAPRIRVQLSERGLGSSSSNILNLVSNRRNLFPRYQPLVKIQVTCIKLANTEALLYLIYHPQRMSTILYTMGDPKVLI